MALTRSKFDDTIDKLLSMFTLEQIVEMGDLTDYDVLRILFEEGHLDVPDYLTHHDISEDTYDEADL